MVVQQEIVPAEVPRGWASRRRQLWFLLRETVTRTRPLLPILGMLVLVFTASSVSAQGCILCYQTAATTGAAGRAALRHGVVILLVPATSLFTAILALIGSRRNPAGGLPPVRASQGN